MFKSEKSKPGVWTSIIKLPVADPGGRDSMCTWLSTSRFLRFRYRVESGITYCCVLVCSSVSGPSFVTYRPAGIQSEERFFLFSAGSSHCEIDLHYI